jgi:hypothetical protein
MILLNAGVSGPGTKSPAKWMLLRESTIVPVRTKSFGIELLPSFRLHLWERKSGISQNCEKFYNTACVTPPNGISFVNLRFVRDGTPLATPTVSRTCIVA